MMASDDTRERRLAEALRTAGEKQRATVKERDDLARKLAKATADRDRYRERAVAMSGELDACGQALKQERVEHEALAQAVLTTLVRMWRGEHERAEASGGDRHRYAMRTLRTVAATIDRELDEAMPAADYPGEGLNLRMLDELERLGLRVGP